MAATDRMSKLVMSVDDSPEILDILKAIITHRGYRFAGAHNGGGCLRMIEQEMPDLVLLDVELPDMDGFEVCRRIRAKPDGDSVPVAFVTVCHSESDVRAAIEAGGNDFIAKPFDVKTLIARVTRWV
jgi:DNA-binding response OmpR family regulator